MTETKLPAEQRPQWEVAIYDPKIKARFLEVMSEQDYFREVILAKQIVSGSDKLQKCSLESIKNAIVNIALIGATLNPSQQEAFLVPRGGKAILDISYRGLIGIACGGKSSIKSMAAQVVYEWDFFEYEQGSTPYVKYKMNLAPPVDMDKIAKDPKTIWDHVVCAFSTATLLDGSVDFVILPKYKLWKIFQSSEGKDNTKMPWQTWPEEQIRKTVIKYHSKTLPKQGNERLANAVKILNEQETASLKPVETTASRVMERFGLEKEGAKAEQAGGKSEAATGDAMNMIACPEKMSMVLESECAACDKIATCKAKE
ncbi:MAG: recombinase RecT [Methanoregula sp.]|jgi:recombination protein RecT